MSDEKEKNDPRVEELKNFFESYMPDESKVNLKLSEWIDVGSRGDRYRLTTDWEGRLQIEYHSGETKVGHSAETSQRDFKYYRGFFESDLVRRTDSCWRLGNNRIIYQDEYWARLFVGEGVEKGSIVKKLQGG